MTNAICKKYLQVKFSTITGTLLDDLLIYRVRQVLPNPHNHKILPNLPAGRQGPRSNNHTISKNKYGQFIYPESYHCK